MGMDSTDKKILRIFSEALKALMSEKDMNQAGLIRVSGVGQSTVSHAYNAKRMPIEENLERITSALGTTYADMLALGELLLKEQDGNVLNPVEQHRKRILLDGESLASETAISWQSNKNEVDVTANDNFSTPSEPTAKDHGNGLFVVTADEEKKGLLKDRAADYMGVPLYESGRLSAGINGAPFYEYEKPSSTVVVYRPELRNRFGHDLRALRVGGDSMSPIIPEGAIVIVDLSDDKFVKGKVFCVHRIDETGEWVASVKRIYKSISGFSLVSTNPNYGPETSDLDWDRLCIGRVVWMWRNIEDI